MGKVKAKIICVVLAALLIFCMSGCVGFNYTDNADISFIEPFGNEGINYYQSGLSAETETAKYLIPSNFSKKERNRFINCQEKVFEYLLANGYIDGNSKFTCYVLKDYASRSESDSKKLFLDISDAGTYMQILVTLQGSFPSMSNYGILYGLSSRIAKELKFQTDDLNISAGQIKSYTMDESNLDYLDLTYPCFVEAYAKDRPDYSKQISVLLTDYAFNINGKDYIIELLSKHETSLAEFETAFVQLKNNWLQSIGSSTVLSENQVPIVYGYNGYSCPLMFRTDHATYFILDSFEELYSELFDGNFHEDYSKMKALIIFSENEMNDVDLIAKNPTFEYADLKIIYCSITEVLRSGKYVGVYYYPNTIRICTQWALLHEYAHHLTTRYSGSYYVWQWEAVACFLGSISYSAKTFYYNALQYPDSSAELEIVQRHLGREYQSDDVFVLFDILVILSDNYSLIYEKRFQLTSFGNYIFNIYGNETAAEILSYPDKVKDKTGKDWTEIVRDWKEYLLATYGYLLTDEAA